MLRACMMNHTGRASASVYSHKRLSISEDLREQTLLHTVSVRKLLVGGGILLAGAIFLYLSGTGGREEGGLKVLSEKVDLQIRDFHYTEVGSPDLTWEINADTATYMKKDEVTLFENVKVRLVFSNGDVYVITGKKGILHTGTKDMDIEGDVRARSNDGAQFETDTLHYVDNAGNGTVRTEDPVKMTRPGIDVRGTGMRLFLREKKVVLLSKVTALIERADQ